MRPTRDLPRPAEGDRPVRRWHIVAIVVIGIGLAAAPAIFQMFSRAPGGGDMLVDFQPYMQTKKIDSFRAELDEIDAAQQEAVGALQLLPEDQRTHDQAVQTFTAQWPGINQDMRSMLTTMEHNIGNYRGVKALPPFWLFPWFFVIPGLLIAGVAAWILVGDRGERPHRRRRIALFCLAAGLIAAPAVFQMFTRAPGGAHMIDDFKPFMTSAKVAKVQGYFLTIGAGEGQLRRAVVPEYAAAAGASPDSVLPAVHALSRDWPAISGDMAPMVGTMADNVDNFGGIAALPPFWLFPWFFVLPGVLVVLFTRAASATIVAGAPASVRDGVRIDRRRVLRGVATAVVVAELGILAAMNLVLDTTKRTTSTIHRAAPGAPAGVLGRRDTPVAAAPGGAATTTGGSNADVAAPPPAGPASAGEPTPPGPTTPVGPTLTCPLPLPLPAPPSGGGVASLTPIVPVFGPFSAEAFAMLPAFQPLFPLFGPLLIAGQQQLDTNMKPALGVLVPAVQQTENAGFPFIALLYTPYRQQFLDAEKALAEQLAAYTKAVAATPGAGCLPAVEAAVTSAGG